MIDGLWVIGVLVWGALLGLMYFGGLWLTLRRLTEVKYQTVWVLGSLAIRNVLAVVGFFPVVKLGWQYALICLLGFILVRFIVVRRISPEPR
ncbi:MAG: ATP synthase subunit I [Methylobacter sp.]|uniref:ATP synthase subunit I n=1 Tax=Candidatus Methylobacter titanis TaxID=3053457 RepID=A0AA43TL65_9GAMM|nr:ATP synthase subunit I [Candidatus Methylobacter titanis]MDI1292907.1 ATP synthase subunit I [Candidatus Methylobacter titanis]